MEVNHARDRRPRRQGCTDLGDIQDRVPYGRSDVLRVSLAGWPRPASVRTGFDTWIEKIDGPGLLSSVVRDLVGQGELVDGAGRSDLPQP